MEGAAHRRAKSIRLAAFLFGLSGEELGSGPFIALGWILFAVSLLYILAAVELLSGQGRGAVLGIATSPVVFALGIGFAVPFLLVTAVLRVALVVAGWSSLRWSSTKARS